jgi:hypothetical protein
MSLRVADVRKNLSTKSIQCESCNFWDYKVNALVIVRSDDKRENTPVVFSCEHITELQNTHQGLAKPDCRSLTTEPMGSGESKRSEDIGWYRYLGMGG